MRIRKSIGAFVAAMALVTIGGCTSSLIPPNWGSWERLTAPGLPGPIPGHEEPIRVTYVNPLVETARMVTQNGVPSLEYPAGSIIVKAGFKGAAAAGQAELPAKLYVMVKNPADPRARGGWLWIVRNGTDPKEIVVDAPYCVDCHGYANKANPYGDRNPGEVFRDYVFLPYQITTTGKE